MWALWTTRSRSSETSSAVRGGRRSVPVTLSGRADHHLSAARSHWSGRFCGGNARYPDPAGSGSLRSGIFICTDSDWLAGKSRAGRCDAEAATARCGELTTVACGTAEAMQLDAVFLARVAVRYAADRPHRNG